MGQKEKGIEYLKKSIQIPKEKSNLGDPLRAVVYNILGKHELQNGNFSEAFEYLNKSQKLAPMQVSSYYYTGLAHIKEANFSLAVNSFENALKNLQSILKGKPLDVPLEDLTEPEAIHFKLFSCYLKLSNLVKAKEYLTKILSKEEFYKNALDILVDEYKNGNRSVIQLLKHISEVRPSFEIFKILSGIYQLEENLASAVETLKKALQYKDDDEIRYNLGVCLTALKKFDEAVKFLSSFLNRRDSKFFESSMKVLASVYFMLGKVGDAMNVLNVIHLEEN
jgi:tetratricopeptide (TPR) repeat protein